MITISLFFSIKFYKEMCEQLTNEKNQLDEEKKHIQQDLSKLQTEIKENANSVKVLEDKMERLQLKRSGHRSSIVVLPEEAKSEVRKTRLTCYTVYMHVVGIILECCQQNTKCQEVN